MQRPPKLETHDFAKVSATGSTYDTPRKPRGGGDDGRGSRARDSALDQRNERLKQSIVRIRGSNIWIPKQVLDEEYENQRLVRGRFQKGTYVIAVICE